MAKTRRFGDKWILADVEAEYANDKAPKASDGVRAKDLTVSPYEGSRIERDYDRPTMGNYPQINASPYVMITFSVELAPAAAAAQAPAYSKLMRACGLKEGDQAEETLQAWAAGTSYTVGDKVTDGVESFICIKDNTAAAANKPASAAQSGEFWDPYNRDVAAKVYTPRDEEFESLSIHFFQGPNRQKILGCRGTFTLSLTRGEIPMIDFSFTGRYQKPETAARVQGSISQYQAPRPITEANTPYWRLFDNAEQYLASLSFDLGNTITFRDLVNHAEVYSTDRKISWTAEVTGADISDFDYYAKLESHLGVDNSGDLVLHHGPDGGRQIRISSDMAQLNTLSTSNSDELLMYNLDGVLIPDRENEFKLEYL